MPVKSFGCSFIFGSDLADSKILGSRSTWPALIAKHQKQHYDCYARPGSGNLQILEQILNQLQDSALYIIGWTWIDRFDYVDSCNDNWNTIRPTSSNKITHNYYRDLHSQYRDKLTNLIYIKSAIDILNQKGYPFIMTYIDDLLFETQWHTSPAIIELQNYIRPHMTQFENKTFLKWSTEKGFTISDNLHPLEEAHRAAFELIKSYNLV